MLLREFVSELDPAILEAIIESHSRFEQQGSIGDEPIRQYAKHFMALHGNTDAAIIQWMNLLAFEAYRKLYLASKEVGMPKYMKFISKGRFVVEVQNESAACFDGVVVFSENRRLAVGENLVGLSLVLFDEISAADLALLEGDSQSSALISVGPDGNASSL